MDQSTAARSFSLKKLLSVVFPVQPYASLREKLLGAVGALVGTLGLVAASSYFVGPGEWAFVIASMGASAALFFAAPHSPMAQPWPFVGGHFISAGIGVSCYLLIPDTYMAASLAVAASIFVMHLLHCLHPPGGATALIAVLGGSEIHQLGYGFLLAPVGVNVLVFLLMALLINNFIPGRRYPPPAQREAKTKPASELPGWPLGKFGLSPGDLENALKEMRTYIDVNETDLEEIYTRATLHAHQRRMGVIHVGDVMTHAVVTAEYGSEIGEIWSLMRERKIKGVPVVDRARRVIGIVTIIDFLKQAGPCEPGHMFDRLCAFVRRIPGLTTDKPEVVGQIMSQPVVTARAEAHIVSLIPLFARHGIHHIPIVDDHDKLVGLVTQSDLMSALYSYRLALG
jgi:CBS domain-containing membrane protein